jgi:hypothetical protein
MIFRTLTRSSLWLALAIAASLAIALQCSPPSGSDGDGDGDTDTDADTDSGGDGDTDLDYDFPSEQGCTKVDILFVIDNSGSMSEEQSNLAANFPQFIAKLEEYRTPADTQLEYRVGLTSTSRSGLVYNASVVMKQGGPECETTDTCPRENQTCECPGRGFEECSDACPAKCYCEPPGMRMPVNETCNGENGQLITPRGYAEPWIDGPGSHVAPAFSSSAVLGTGGCSMEMPLYAMEHALSPEFHSAPGGANAGFLRDDALLMVIVITDEDDCSSNNSVINQESIMDINHPFAGTSGDAGCTDADGNTLDDQYLPMDHYIEFLDGLMGIRSHWTMAVIAGQQACDSAYGNAFTAHRLGDFVDLAGSNTVFSDICAADLAGALDEALDILQIACDDYVLI